MEENNVYTSLWRKYKPVILKLMTDSSDGPQEYPFYIHEFKALNDKERSFSFEVEVIEGKAKRVVKQSRAALDLVEVLRQSASASQMMNDYIFEFSLDRNFIFHIERKAEAC
ncbi:MAG: hypothetical protein OEY51_13415 [Cyclobacteriaceae bacterium]|nr:hypothetical protein [Cyclobacteriaceae bacterium]